jgi:hypothetical protein
MIENRPWLTVVSHVVLMAIVIGLTVLQFKWIERKVQY